MITDSRRDFLKRCCLAGLAGPGGLNSLLSAAANDDPRDTNDVKAAFDRIEADLKEEPKLTDPGRRGINFAYADDLLSIIAYWATNDRSAVELGWWRAHHRDARLLVIALFRLEYGDQDIAIRPDFKRASERFAPREVNERKEEINEVEAHFPDVKPRLEKAIQLVRKRIGTREK